MTDPDTTNYDLLVIGFGKAGKTIVTERGNAGDKVAIIEASPKMYGGTCINIACVPSKALINATNRNLDWGAAVDTRDELIAKLNETNLKLAHNASVAVIDGSARFTGQREVTVTGVNADELTLTAEKVVINTGATPRYPPIAGLDGPRVHNSTTIQHISPRPERRVIVGEKKEVLVDAQRRTSAASIWAAGDVHGGAQQTYLCYDDYRLLSSQLSGAGSESWFVVGVLR